MNPFVHLHVHSQYSVLDGQASVSGLVDKAVKNGMKAIALTDHGNMFGIKEFTDYINKKNKSANPENKIKPIIGCEVYVARNGLQNKRKEVKSDARGWHLILLAKNHAGYKNLLKIVSKAWTDGFYFNPRTDHAELEKYHENLVCCSACLGGEIPQHITNNELDKAEESVLWFKNLFGDDFYLELQRHKPTSPNGAQDTYPKQVEVNKHLIELSKKHNIKIIASNDVHFINEDDAEAHHRLICLNTGHTLNDELKMAYTMQEWFKTQEEMNAIFSDIPEALTNTLEIADKVEYYSIEHGPIMPNFPLPEGFNDDESYLKYLTYEGAKKMYPDMTKEIKDRIDFELETIFNMGFPGYFLIVQDFTSAAKEIDVSVGPGRGSAAGSAVAYCLGITKIDPIKYDLLFERFLNPDRISLPDIDIDFDDDGRDRILHWVENKYGKEKVAHIITYGTMAAKSAIKDVGRVEGIPLADANRLAKMVPDRLPDVKKVNLSVAIDKVPELKKEYEYGEPLIKDTLFYAKKLEGTVRNTGVHACGIIIGRDAISDWVPVSTADDKKEGKLLVTQYEGSTIESTGLIKMDFLGLKTLSIIKDAVNNVKISKDIDIDIDNISLEDEKTFKLYQEGKTVGTFQFESAGMQKYLRELQPTTFEDLIAMNALYRPGPMDYIPEFIARKHGKKEIVYDFPEMERYLKDTYGITVYQEQVMLLSRELAGFTRGESDTLRKAMGKKLKDKLDKLKPKFLKGGQEKGHDAKTLERIWSDWEKFASYAFNKSHATCYSYVAYQTAWLKANYPSEYMAAVLTRNINNITDITKYMDECQKTGIQVLGPDINESNYTFSVNKKGDIRFGLGAIKGVGENAVQAIINERKDGPYKDIFDFFERVNLSTCNKKCIESIAIAGGFDSMEQFSREQFVAPMSKGETFLDRLVKYGTRASENKQSNSISLFGESVDAELARPKPPKVDPWPSLIKLEKEKNLIGMYLSAHPLDDYSVIIKYLCNKTMVDIKEENLEKNHDFMFGGIVTDIRERISKKGSKFAFVTLEDYSGSAEIPFWSNAYLEFGKYLSKANLLLLHGRYQPRQWRKDEYELVITKIEILPEVAGKLINNLNISLYLNDINNVLIEDMVEIISEKKGSCNLHFNIKHSDGDRPINTRFLSKKFKINPDKKLVTFLEENNNLKFEFN